MRKVFIADAHLNKPEDANYSRLLAFLDGLTGNTETLFILGDLFEFWIGYPRVSFPHYLPVLEKLRSLREAGTGIVYFEGNHDFHMGPYFRDILQATVYPEPALLTIDGKRAYLCHGDQMNDRDYGYRLLRLLFHSRLTGLLTHVVPPTAASAIARRLGDTSRASHDTRRSRWDYRSIMEKFAAARFAEGCDLVVTGHFHIPLLEKSGPASERTLLSLGDWISHFTYGEMADGAMSLHRYPSD